MDQKNKATKFPLEQVVQGIFEFSKLPALQMRKDNWILLIKLEDVYNKERLLYMKQIQRISDDVPWHLSTIAAVFGKSVLVLK